MNQKQYDHMMYRIPQLKQELRKIDDMSILPENFEHVFIQREGTFKLIEYYENQCASYRMINDIPPPSTD
jgi:hypothetical protein